MAKIFSVALLGMGGFIYAAGACAQSTGNAKLDDLQSLVSKYDAPVVGSSAVSGIAQVIGAPVTVVRKVASTLPLNGAVSGATQALKSTLASVPPVGASVRVSSALAAAHVVADAGRAQTRVALGAAVHPDALAATVSRATSVASALPVVGKALSGPGDAASALVSSLPTISASTGSGMGAHPSVLPLVADRRRLGNTVSSRARALGIADGESGQTPPAGTVNPSMQTLAARDNAIGSGQSPVMIGTPVGTVTGVVDQVVGDVTTAASKLPVAGPVVAQVGNALTSATSGNGNVSGAVGQIVGDVTTAASKLPVAGPVVAQVGNALTSATSGNGNVSGTVGQVVGDVTTAASKLPVAGPVVAQVGGTLGSIASGQADLGTTVGQVTGGLVNNTSTLPVVGSTVASAGQALKTVTSGGSIGGGLEGQAGLVVGQVVNSLSQTPGVGPVVAKVGQTLQEATAPIGHDSGSGGVGSTVSQVLGNVTAAASKLPVAGPVVAQVGNALTSATSGSGSVSGTVSQVLGNVTTAASKLPVAGPVVAQVGNALTSATSGSGNVSGTVSQVLGKVTAAASKLPVAGPVVAQVGNALTSATSGHGTATGVVGQVVGGVTTDTSTIPVVGPLIGQVGDALALATSGGGSTSGSSGQLASNPTDTVSSLPVVGSSLGQLGQVFAPMTSTNSLAAANVPSTTSATTNASTMSVPTVPPPSATPTGLIIGNGGVVGTASQLLGSSENALFTNSDANGYITNGSLKVSNANFTQGYSTVNLLGLPVLNSTAVGTVLTTTGGTVLGGTGANSHLTLIGGVTSGNYITNINNGAAGGIAGLVLPSGAPAWASTCTNVLGVVTESCWAVNAAQDYQVLVGDGASANGSKEVVIGTNASHTLPPVDASQAFPGSGANDPNNPTGVPTADYQARLGHSVVIGDSASGSANAQTILGAEATASAANSVALGYQSSASRGAQTGYRAYGLSAPQNSAGEVSIGSPGQERQITNVAAGSAATDAVNVAQLEAVASTAGNAVEYDDATRASVTLGGTTSTDGGVTNGTTITNLHQGALSATSTDAVNGAQLWHWTQDTTNQYSNYSLYNDIQNISPGTGPGSVKYFNANSTLADSSATGDNSVAIGPQAKSSGTNSVAMGNGASATAGNSVAIGAGSVADRANTVSVGSAGNERQITNVAAGTAATDAVNVSQLNSAIGTTTKGTVRYDTNSDGSVDYNSVTLGNGSGDTTIHNVAAGTQATDAANVGQVQQAVDWSKTYTDQRFGQLSGQLQDLSHRADAGVAAAMASAGLPQAYEPGHSMAAVSAGSFRGESSIAIGVSTISEGGRWVYKVAGSADTRGDAGISVGAGMQW